MSPHLLPRLVSSISSKSLAFGLTIWISFFSVLSAHSDHDSVMKGIIHGACDYLVKPVGLKELRNIWQHVVKKNIHSYKKNIGSSRQLHTSSDSNLATSVSKKRKEKVNDSGDDENDSDRDEEYGDGSEQDGDESSTRKKPRVVWSQELHQKFVTAVQQLGLDSEFTYPLKSSVHVSLCVVSHKYLVLMLLLQRLSQKRFLIS